MNTCPACGHFLIGQDKSACHCGWRIGYVQCRRCLEWREPARLSDDGKRICDTCRKHEAMNRHVASPIANILNAHIETTTRGEQQ